MSLKQYIEYIKQDMHRTVAAANFFKSEHNHTYFFRIFLVFILNVAGIACFTIMKEDFPMWIFICLCGISTLVIFDTLWQFFSENISKELPNVFAEECKRHINPLQDFKCYVNFIGNIHFRGFKCRIYIYEKDIIIKFGKNCLVVDNGKQIEINKIIFGYRCEFSKEGKYVQCNLNKKQVEILREWQNKNSDKK
ncbi:MAG: hypothetical protein J6039_03095 [Alphaproteobacteria bacterium]|nr:hypothetical protein [Alphaproteobacteria bacterium]